MSRWLINAFFGVEEKIERAVKDPDAAFYFIKVRPVITQDLNSPYSQYYDEAMQNAIKSVHAYEFIYDNFISEDSPYYEQILENSSNQVMGAYNLLDKKIITEDSPYYDNAMKTLLHEAPGFVNRLVLDRIISEDSPYYNEAKAISDTVRSRRGISDSSKENE